jgi:hypothetical protein
MLKKETGVSPLRALQDALRQKMFGGEQKGGIQAQMGEEAATPEANPALMVGEKLIQNLAASMNVSESEAAALLMESAPDGLKGVSARAANELLRLKKENALSGEPEDYANDPAFLALLGEFPAKAALRVYIAEKSLKEARQDGARDLMEKLAARRALPAPLNRGVPAAPETDFSTMPSEQFRALKNQFSRAAQQKRGAN